MVRKKQSKSATLPGKKEIIPKKKSLPPRQTRASARKAKSSRSKANLQAQTRALQSSDSISRPNHSHNTRSRKLFFEPEEDYIQHRRKSTLVQVPSISTSSIHTVGPQRYSVIQSVEVNSSSEQSLEAYLEAESSTSETSIEFNFKQTGLAFPINDRQADLIKLVLRHPDMCAKIVKNRKDVTPWLVSDRNVDLKPTSDTFDFETLEPDIKDEAQTYSEILAYHDIIWDLGKAKCEADNEAIFQRTLMLSMINRYCLYTDSKYFLDFSVEEVWSCPPMPTRGLLNSGQQIVPLPWPDLCVSFQADKLLPWFVRQRLSPTMQRMIMVEGLDIPQCNRAFPFLTIEAKNGTTSNSYKTALSQCLNAASQGLHNMYEFFREVDMLKEFFKTVRFFTVAATASGCIFRMHRVVDGDCDTEIVPGYNLIFQYEEIGNFSGGNYTRRDVLDKFEKIFWGYAPQLRGLIEKAFLKFKRIMATKGYDERLRNRDESYYRHGQVTRKSDSRVRSQAPSSKTSKRARDPGEPTSEPTFPSRSASVVSRGTASTTFRIGSESSSPLKRSRKYHRRGQATMENGNDDDDCATTFGSFQDPRQSSPGFAYTSMGRRDTSQGAV